jgi:hypothetical protein
VKDYNLFYLQDPTRLVVDVRGTSHPAVASAGAEPVAARATAAPSPAPAPTAPSPAPSIPDERPVRLPPRRVSPLTPPDPPPAAGRAAGSTLTIEGPEPSRPASSGRSAPPAPPQPPQVNRAGSYSLARQLRATAATTPGPSAAAASRRRTWSSTWPCASRGWCGRSWAPRS